MQPYDYNRKALMKRLPDGLIVLAGAEEILRNGDVHFPYRQLSNFLYLTGAEEPGYALLLDPKRRKEILFVPRLTQEHAVWLGHIPGPAEAARRYGFRDVRYGEELPALVRKLKKGYRAIYANKQARRHVSKAAGALKFRPAELQDALEELRAVKNAAELRLIEKANAVTAAGHLAAMRAARPGLYEYEVQAELERPFQAAGLSHTAYPSIVAGGKNSAVLHYHHNNAKLRAGELLLIDAAAECRGYAADVTRTFPVSGKFTAAQREIYEAVLDAHEQCIDRARPGITSLDLHKHSERVLTEGMRALGFLKGTTEELLETEAVRVFYPHGLSHMLGLDVHDVTGGRKRRIPVRRNGKLRYHAVLEPGFVITVEPGIYFIEALVKDEKLRRKHRGRIDFAKAERYLNFGGVRIEDDVVVRAKGPARSLTDVPKKVKDVEAACRG